MQQSFDTKMLLNFHQKYKKIQTNAKKYATLKDLRICQQHVQPFIPTILVFTKSFGVQNFTLQSVNPNDASRFFYFKEKS